MVQDEPTNARDTGEEQRNDAPEATGTEPAPAPASDAPPNASSDAPPEGAGDADALAEKDAEIARLREELDAARRESAGHLERVKRTLADFENYKRRTRGEAQQAREKGQEEVVLNLLAVLDNFDRALEHAGDEEALYDGLKLIYKQMRSLLEDRGLQRIDSEGHAFDPNLHEAVMREPTTAYKEGVVIKELERGYYLRDRVLRPAKVKVAVAPEESAEDEEGDAATGE